MLNTVTNPQTGAVGGDWAVFGLARSAFYVPSDFYENYFAAVEAFTSERGGILHENRLTENSRVILALAAAGYDPRSVAGYDLTAPLEDFDAVISQGINGAVYALLALDCNDYPNSRREDYLAEILRRQLDCGGWSLTGNTGDPDVTGMALQALAKYLHRPEAADAATAALEYLSGQQNDNGGFTSWGSEGVGSTVQVLVALCELGVPVDDPRFVKNGTTLIDNILSFKNPDGSFSNTRGGGVSRMASEQALYGLAAAQRVQDGKQSLYRMDGSFTVTLTVRADTLLINAGLLNRDKRGLVPEDGVIYPLTSVTAFEGDSVFDVLRREMRRAGIHIAFQSVPFYGSSYVEAIHNIYEFDAGALSGWKYSINGSFAVQGASQTVLRPGDAVEWHYTCDLGRDLGQGLDGGRRDE
jgi:hypothetical protein